MKTPKRLRHRPSKTYLISPLITLLSFIALCCSMLHLMAASKHKATPCAPAYSRNSRAKLLAAPRSQNKTIYNNNQQFTAVTIWSKLKQSVRHTRKHCETDCLGPSDRPVGRGLNGFNGKGCRRADRLAGCSPTSGHAVTSKRGNTIPPLHTCTPHREQERERERDTHTHIYVYIYICMYATNTHKYMYVWTYEMIHCTCLYANNVCLQCGCIRTYHIRRLYAYARVETKRCLCVYNHI